MQFYHILEMLDGYKTEKGTSGHRFEGNTWAGLESKLKAEITRLRSLEPKTFKPGMTVAELKAIHNQHQLNVGTTAAVAKCKAKIQELREWLAREGVTPDADGNIRDLFGDVKNSAVSPGTVVYDEDSMLRKANKIRFSGGMLYSDDACTQPASTDDMVTHFSGPGYGAFVMSAKGSLYIGSHIVGKHHHSSLKCARPVACAGEIKIVKGRLDAITNKSGHYWPSEIHLLQVMAMLEKRQVRPHYRVGTLIGRQVKWYPNPAAFLSARKLDGKTDWELVKLMSYDAYLDDATLNTNNWRIARPDESIDFAVVDCTTKRPVPHAEVRKWFKSKGMMPAVLKNVRQ